MKLDLLTNATVVDDAIRFVSQKGVTAANAELKTHTVSIDKEKQQQQQEDNNNREQKSDNNAITTVNQVF
jgi:hypothetical protein